MKTLTIVLFLLIGGSCYSQEYTDTNKAIGKFYRALKGDLNSLSQQKEKYKTKTAIDLDFYGIIAKIEYNQTMIFFIESLYKKE